MVTVSSIHRIYSHNIIDKSKNTLNMTIIGPEPCINIHDRLSEQRYHRTGYFSNPGIILSRRFRAVLFSQIVWDYNI
jgi:hypothetical protein